MEKSDAKLEKEAGFELEKEEGNAVKSPKYSSVDEIFYKIKPWSRYQWFLTFMYGYHFTIVSINDGFMAFAYAYNNTIVTAVDSHCDLFYNCQNFSYVYDFYSINVQYNLVCERAYYVELITSLQFFGILVGALVSGPIVDYFGRKWTFLTCVTAEIILGSSTALAPTWEIHAFIRVLIGLFAGADMNAGWVFLGEFTVNKYRFLFRALALIIPKVCSKNDCSPAVKIKPFMRFRHKKLTSAALIIQQITFPLVGLCGDWRYLEVIGNCICIPVIIIIVFIPESPRWLIQKGRTEEAAKILKQVAKWNGNADFHITAEELPVPEVIQTVPFWRLFDNWKISRYSMAMAGTWFVSGLINYGIFFDLGNLPFNIYITQAIVSMSFMVVELPFAFADMYFPRMNRKLFLLLFIGLSSVCTLVVSIFFFTGTRQNFLLTFLAIAGHSFIAIVLDLGYVYQIELFPTLLRSSAGSLGSVSARLGAIVAPQLLYLENRCTSCGGIPYIVFACIAAAGFIFDFIILPNTKDKVLMESVSDELKELHENEFVGSSPPVNTAHFVTQSDKITVYPEN